MRYLTLARTAYLDSPTPSRFHNRRMAGPLGQLGVRIGVGSPIRREGHQNGGNIDSALPQTLVA